jgi:hypothetical protein
MIVLIIKFDIYILQFLIKVILLLHLEALITANVLIFRILCSIRAKLLGFRW